MELPDRASMSAVVARYARLLARFGAELGTRPLVLPNGEFFPDAFRRDEASASTLVHRMMEHAGLDDVPLAVKLVHEDAPEAPHEGCSSGCQVPAAMAGSVPRLVDDGNGWTLHVPEYELSHSVVLTTMAARALGHVFLVETLATCERVEPPVDLTADYAAVALGFGPLLLEGAYIYSKGCGGPQVATVTAAAIEELAVLTALFVELGRHSARRALAELGVTQQALLSQALDVVKTNGRLVDKLRKDPQSVATSDIRLEDSKPWLVRLFGKKKSDDDFPFEGFEPRARATAPKAPDPARDELRALVEEALVESRTAEPAE